MGSRLCRTLERSASLLEAAVKLHCLMLFAILKMLAISTNTFLPATLPRK